MRMMLRISMSVEASTKAINDRLMPKLVQQTTELIKPEATYFTADHGVRTAYFFFDMTDVSQMPVIAEPWFSGTHAKIELMPVMSAEELRVGLDRALGK